MNRPAPSSQPVRPARGVAVLQVTLILMLLSSIGIYYAARSSINEQRLSANELRTQHAYSAAMAGQDLALAYFSAGSDISSFAAGTASLTNASYQVSFCSPSAPVPACPTSASGTLTCTAPGATEMRTPQVVSCGWSDDSLAVIRMVQKVAGSPSMGGNVTSPSVTAGANNLLTGGGSILNYYNDLTVWSGGPVPSQSATGKTFIRDVTTDPTPSANFNPAATGVSPGCNNPPAGYTCSTNGTNLGADVITSDTVLSTLSSDAFFTTFMGASPTSYRDTTATYKVNLDGTLAGANSSSVSSLTGMSNQVIWVQGSVNTSIGDIGSRTAPVVLVINGDWNVNASPTIYGLVFVTGNVTGTGSPTVVGALISGQLTLNGNGKIIYDPIALTNASRLGKPAIVPGSWRDW